MINLFSIILGLVALIASFVNLLGYKKKRARNGSHFLLLVLARAQSQFVYKFFIAIYW